MHQFATRAIHEGFDGDFATGAIMPPIYQTSTYKQLRPGVALNGEPIKYEYSRTKNPTRDFLQDALASIENGTYCNAFSSGLAATETVIKNLKPGDEVIAAQDMYGGTYRLFTKVWADFGIKFLFADFTNSAEVAALVTANTKLVWLETPSNPLLTVIDIKAIAAITQPKGITLVVDNTFGTPYLQNPLDLGADVVMHSLTKYLAGHSDVVMGALITNNKELADRYQFLMNSTGNNPGPFDAWLVLRGLKTLHVRMDRHCHNAGIIANWLVNHPDVDTVLYPGLESHPTHHIAKEQMRGYGGMLSFTLKGDDYDRAVRIMSSLKIFALGESLGGVESICTHPASMTHASVPKAEREARGFKDTLIRLSVGIEHVEDLLADLDQALKA